MYITGHNETWHSMKSNLLKHIRLIGEGSSVHKKAIKGYRKDQRIEAESHGIIENVIQAAITDIKVGAAAQSLDS